MTSFNSRARMALASRDRCVSAASLLLGILVGFGAALLVWAMELVSAQRSETDALLGFGKWIFLISIPLGLLAAWLLNRWVGPGVSGGGVAETMVSVNLEAGHLPMKIVPSKIVATAATLGTGGSGGREGPIVLIGGAIGSSLREAFAIRSGSGEESRRCRGRSRHRRKLQRPHRRNDVRTRGHPELVRGPTRQRDPSSRRWRQRSPRTPSSVRNVSSAHRPTGWTIRGS